MVVETVRILKEDLDIVHSAQKYAEVHKRTGTGVTLCVEYMA